jgi:hypothetical protein
MQDAADLGELVGQLALDAMRTQQLWNEAHQREMAEFELLLSAQPKLTQWLLPLVPKLLSLNRFETAASLQLITSRETGFQLTGKFLNIEYSRRFGVSFESASRIGITVEQYPIQAQEQTS